VLGELPLIAEDLGVITPAVTRLRRAVGFPGMAVLQFGFGSGDPANVHHPSNHAEDVVVYTGTHDNDTVRGWYESLSGEVRAEVDAEIERFGVRERAPQWSLIRLAFASPARVAMTQMQDVLGLGSEARMNTPGRSAGAWKWRLDRLPGKDHARRLRAATEASGRL
jgi:4-alpha-glucanotransferase